MLNRSYIVHRFDVVVKSKEKFHTDSLQPVTGKLSCAHTDAVLRAVLVELMVHLHCQVIRKAEDKCSLASSTLDLWLTSEEQRGLTRLRAEQPPHCPVDRVKVGGHASSCKICLDTNS